MLIGLLISLPLLVSLLLFALKDRPVQNRKIALASSLVTFVIAGMLLMQYLAQPANYPVFHPEIFHSLGIEFSLGLDNLTIPVAVIAASYVL